MAVGLAAALPCVVLPALLHGSHEKGKPWHQQYWVKANVWIAIFSFIGNYFWTHYFYELLGAEYTFPSWQLNKVRSVLKLHQSQLDAVWMPSALSPYCVSQSAKCQAFTVTPPCQTSDKPV